MRKLRFLKEEKGVSKEARKKGEVSVKEVSLVVEKRKWIGFRIWVGVWRERRECRLVERENKRVN